jgi:hypothetical protein
MIRFIEKVGFFRLTLLPLGIIIIVSAITHQLLGMGLIGGVVLVFGSLNKCLLGGSCEIDAEKTSGNKFINPKKK